MTANVFKEDIEKCLSGGFDGHIGKPINFGLLTETLKQYLK
jgi:CheY-like chemotaxis protein